MRELRASITERKVPALLGAMEGEGEQTELDAYERLCGVWPGKETWDEGDEGRAMRHLIMTKYCSDEWPKTNDAEVESNELRERGDPEADACEEGRMRVKNVVSTVTTTETVVDPDGTTRKKTVIRRRFADGSQEEIRTNEKTNGEQGEGNNETKLNAQGQWRHPNGDERMEGRTGILEAVYLMELAKARMMKNDDENDRAQTEKDGGKDEGKSGEKDREVMGKKGGWFWS